MSLSTSLLRTLFFALSYLLLTVGAATAQSQYATSIVPTPINTTDAAKAADQNRTTAAVLQPNLIQAGTATERVQFSTVIPAGSRATGLSMQINNVASNLVMASVLGSITVKTYLNGVPKETWQASSLINLNILDPARQNDIMLSPSATADFNQIELSAASTVSAYSISFYEAFGPSPAPLPVQLVSFQGKATAAGVALGWQTASELHNSHFVIERAAPGETVFSRLGQVAGAGSSSQARRYQYLDAAPLALGYYRLGQVDESGQVTYSAVVAVQSAPEDGAPGLAAFPNPAVATLTVATATATQVAIFDQQGRLLQQASLAAGAQALDVSSLPAGLYWLRDTVSGQRLSFAKAH